MSANHWAAKHIYDAYTHGWINGYPDGTFRPDQFITRAETAKIINIQFGRKIDEESLAKVANPYNNLDRSYWGYADIIEASFLHEYVRGDEREENWLTW